MKIEIFNGKWTNELVSNNPDKLYVFGDNDLRMGKGGQAIIRDLSNSIGIRTKKGPSKKPVAFYNDSELELNKSKILEDIIYIKYLAISTNKKLVFSSGGYGTGLSMLLEKAPLTFEYLNSSLLSHFGFDNKRGVRFSKIPGHNEIYNGKSIYLENTLIPVNNSYFKSEFLSIGLNTNLDLIKSGNKIAITSDHKYNRDDILLVKNKGADSCLVCRVIDSFSIDLVRGDIWYEFEGYDDTDFKVDFDLDKYQTHFEFICLLENSGRMYFKDDLFGEPVSLKKNNELREKRGEPIKVEFVNVVKPVGIFERILRVFKKKTISELLLNIGINSNQYKLIKDKDNKFYGKYELYHNMTYYYLDFKKGFFKNKLDVILISSKKVI
jgi:hypothetical protein